MGSEMCPHREATRGSRARSSSLNHLRTALPLRVVFLSHLHRPDRLQWAHYSPSTKADSHTRCFFGVDLMPSFSPGGRRLTLAVSALPLLLVAGFVARIVSNAAEP